MFVLVQMGQLNTTAPVITDLDHSPVAVTQGEIDRIKRKYHKLNLAWLGMGACNAAARIVRSTAQRRAIRIVRIATRGRSPPW